MENFKERREAKYEKEKTTRSKRLATALLLSGMVHGGAFLHEEIGDASQDVVRSARQLEKSTESRAKFEKLQDKLETALESEPSIDINLSHFYLENEVLNGGVSEKEAKRAVHEYSKIINEARGLVLDGDSEEEVLGFVLKNQGEYDRESAHLTDLLNDGTGNCDARSRFINSAVQDIYPDIVENGELQFEVFGAYVDENGVKQDGHIRTVIDRGDTVTVLEGSAISIEPKSEHEDIPRYETTHTVAQAALAYVGMYEYEMPADSVDTVMRDTGTRDNGWSSARTNSTLSYPPSNAQYTGGSSQDIAREQVHGSWAPEPREWRADFELEEAPKTLDVEAFESLQTVRGRINIQGYDYVDDEVWDLIVQKFEEHNVNHYLYVDGSQKLNLDQLKKTRNLTLLIDGAPAPDAYSGLSVQGLRFNFSKDDLDDDREIILNNFGGADLNETSLTIVSGNAPIKVILTPEVFSNTTLIQELAVSGKVIVSDGTHAHIRSVVVNDLTINEGSLESEYIGIYTWRKLEKRPSLLSGQISNVTAGTGQFLLNNISTGAFADSTFGQLIVNFETLEDGAFSGLRADTLVIGNLNYPSYSKECFNGAEIGKLFLKAGVPEEMKRELEELDNVDEVYIVSRGATPDGERFFEFESGNWREGGVYERIK